MATTTVDLSTLDGTNGFRLDGADVADFADDAVAAAGDVNGDGFGDLLVGAYYANTPGGLTGAAYVIFGKESGFAAAINLGALGADGVVIEGVDPVDFTGGSVAGAGDVDGDGFDDILIGARQADGAGNGKATAGEAIVVNGSATLAGTIDLSTAAATVAQRFEGAAAGDGAGRSVSGAGDVNGDGFADFIVGASEAGAAGAAHVVFGDGAGFAAVTDLAALDGGNGFRLDGVAADDDAGASVAGGFDFNADGFADLLVGAPGGAESYVLFGRKDGFAAAVDAAALDGSDGFAFGRVGTDFTGFSVAGAGDVNGDGVDDIVVGTPYAAANGGNSGAAFVIFGSTSAPAARLETADLDGTNGFRMDGLAGDRAGFAVDGAGDVNGDGVADLLIGAPGAEAAFVVFGRADGFAASLDLATLDATQGFRIDGIVDGDGAGSAVSGAGDVDGDGFDDLLIGASSAQPNGLASGQAYVVFGFDTGLVTHQGGSVRDVLSGTVGADVMVLGQGNDAFTAGDGDDVVRAGAGVDSGTLGAGNDVAYGGAGLDTIDGGTGNDILYGEAGNDRLTVGSGQDIVYGGTGDDQIFVVADEVGAGDRIFGGEGDRDILQSMSGSVLDLTAADAFQGIEQVNLGAAQTVIGVDQDLRWVGSAGADVFNLGAGADTVTADRGADQIAGGGGDDRLIGGTLDDVINGEAGADTLQGDAGADTLDGGTENDRLFAGSGDDTLMGGAGEDFLDGSGGSDTYNGGAGADRLSSRLDGLQDTFLFEVGTGSDRVFRYEEGVDRIGISSAFGFADGADALASMTSAEINGSGHAILNLNGADVIQLINFAGLNPGAVIADLADDIFIF